jgi:oxygen-independent coproporphyrinogen-3 oxidase
MPALIKPHMVTINPISGDEPLGIYIHWPFCAAKCPYCDFNSHVRSTIDEVGFERAFMAELDFYKSQLKGGRTASIFLGGGTPSLMPPALTEKLINKVLSLFPTEEGVTPEITLEANPGSVEAGKFKDFRAAGVNRVSIGVQSLRDDVLKSLGRVHQVDEALQAIKLAKTTFDRFSFDMIYARQNQTLGDWKQELSEALELAEGHLSLYQLTIEPGTAYYQQHKRGQLILPNENLSADMFEMTQEMTNKAGLPAYEISNHAILGQESQHNLIYWQGGGYLGIGPGAHGRIPQGAGKSLAHNQLKKPESWLSVTKSQGHGMEDSFIVSGQDRAEELVMMGLRLSSGIDAKTFKNHAGQQLSSTIDMVEAQAMQDAGLLEVIGDLKTNGVLRLSPLGRPLLNSVLRNLLQA